MLSSNKKPRKWNRIAQFECCMFISIASVYWFCLFVCVWHCVCMKKLHRERYQKLLERSTCHGCLIIVSVFSNSPPPISLFSILLRFLCAFLSAEWIIPFKKAIKRHRNGNWHKCMRDPVATAKRMWWKRCKTVTVRRLFTQNRTMNGEMLC